MKIAIEKISAITLKVTDMKAAVKFYADVLGMELLYGGPRQRETTDIKRTATLEAQTNKGLEASRRTR